MIKLLVELAGISTASRRLMVAPLDAGRLDWFKWNGYRRSKLEFPQINGGNLQLVRGHVDADCLPCQTRFFLWFLSGRRVIENSHEKCPPWICRSNCNCLRCVFISSTSGAGKIACGKRSVDATTRATANRERNGIMHLTKIALHATFEA